MVRVQNIRDKNFKEPKDYSSWIEYWEDKMGRDAQACSRVFCSIDEDIVGGHVKKVPDDGNIYLIPLCRGHNTYVYINPYSVPDNVLLVVPECDLEEEV